MKSEVALDKQAPLAAQGMTNQEVASKEKQ
jgi:hypothetical protein